MMIPELGFGTRLCGIAGYRTAADADPVAVPEEE